MKRRHLCYTKPIWFEGGLQTSLRIPPEYRQNTTPIRSQFYVMNPDNYEFYRTRRLPPYLFAEVNRMKLALRQAGSDVIDFGMGNPDMAPPEHVISKLTDVLNKPRIHRYSQSRGVPGLRKAFAGYYARRFGVELDPESEVVATIGSKEGLANLAMAITAPGDIMLVPNPSYPIHAFGFIIAGASLRYLPTATAPDFFERLKRAVEYSVPKPMALVLNYPSNPTAEVVDLDFYQQVVDFCRHQKIYLLSDLAYAEIYFDDQPPPSVLQVPGAKEIAIEFSSLSKTYSMAGWRVGFAAGNPTLIAALARIKSYLDYGAFTAIQVAATAALNGPQDYVETLRTTYRKRRDVLAEGLVDAGWEVRVPSASMYLWQKIPEPFDRLGSLAFSKLLLEKAQVAVSAGVGFGEYGDGHVRMALVENEQRIRQATRSIRHFMLTHCNVDIDRLRAEYS